MSKPFVWAPKKPKKPPQRAKDDGTLKPLKRITGEFVTPLNCAAKECRWPYGDDPAELVLCGRTVERMPYCQEHRARAFIKPVKATP